MKTLELYIEILRRINYETLNLSDDLRLNNFEFGSPTYRAIVTINDAANQLSSLIDVMKKELSIASDK